ncbi:site-specific integrase [Gammaproteobacteria bacterium]|nr:site-specific integrase [Gammaproteobacteria bacterium]
MKQAKVLNEIEIRKLLKVCELTRYAERNRLMVMLSFLSGMRAVEIANLRISNVISEHNEVLDLIVLDKTQTKGNKRQTIIVNKQLKKEIMRFIAKFPNILKNKNGFLLKTQKGNFNSQTIQNLFRHLFKLANIQQASSHSGRRTYITKLAENGVAVPIIQKLARHSSLSTTQRYIEVSEDKLFNAVNTINV